MIYIYNLICPITKKVRYVGQSKRPKTRYRQHLKDASGKTNTMKKKWIFCLKCANLYPLIEIVGEYNNSIDARIAEENNVIKNIETIYNIHLPGKGSSTVEYYKKTGKIIKCQE